MMKGYSHCHGVKNGMRDLMEWLLESAGGLNWLLA